MLLAELKRLHLWSTASPSATLLIGNFLKFDQALHEFIQDEREKMHIYTLFETLHHICASPWHVCAHAYLPTCLVRSSMWVCFIELS